MQVIKLQRLCKYAVYNKSKAECQIPKDASVIYQSAKVFSLTPVQMQHLSHLLNSFPLKPALCNTMNILIEFLEFRPLHLY